MKWKVLCVDDDKLGLQVRKELLEIAGYEVIAAVDPVCALKLFAECEFDLAIVDFHLGEDTINGSQLARLMKRLRPNIPLVMLTADTHISEEDKRTVDVCLFKGTGSPDKLHVTLKQLFKK